MRIAVLSDTHDHYPPGLPERLRRANEIWHLGDVCDPNVLVEFDLLGPTVRVVAGNSDDYPWPVSLVREVEGMRCHLTHIPPPHPPSGCHLVLHGHTHVPRDEFVDGVRFLCPGCISRPRGDSPSTFAWLEIARGSPVRWTLERV